MSELTAVTRTPREDLAVIRQGAGVAATQRELLHVLPREIAAAADLSIPALYQYVKSKEDILFMITSLTLSYIATQDSRSTIFGDGAITETLPAAGAESAAADAGAGMLEEIEAPVADQAETP